jgi:protocatechuate 4,5-dioxygenase alpha chain
LIRIKAALIPRWLDAFAKDRFDPQRRQKMGIHATPEIPGTPIFDGDAAQKGYALNRMCFSFNSAENRAEFLRDEDAYCAKFRLTPAQRAAVKHRNVLEMIEAGGNVYYLAKLAGIFGLNVQDIGAQQTGMTVEAFKAKLAAAGR